MDTNEVRQIFDNGGGVASMGNIELGLCQQGWQCPICKRVYSPFTSMCLYCGSGETKATTTTDTYFDIDKILNSYKTTCKELNKHLN